MQDTLEHERAIISALLFDRGALSSAGGLEPEDFSDVFLGACFRAVTELAANNEPIDALAVGHKIGMDTVKKHGGITYLFSLAEQGVTAVSVGYHTRLVTAASASRKLVSLMRDSIEALEANGEPLIASETILSKTLAITQRCANTKASDANHIADLCLKTIERIAAGEIIGTPTGIKRLDENLMCLMPSLTYCLTASAPGMGKSALVMQIVANAAATGNVLYISGEMKNFNVFLRDISRRSRVPVPPIRTLRLGTREADQVGAAISDFRAAKIHVIDRRGVTFSDIARETMRLKAIGPVSLVAVDMVQHLDAPGRDEWQQIDTAVRYMSAIAEQYDVPVLYVSRANRRDTGGIPTLATPFGSSRIESDACGIFALCRTEDYIAHQRIRLTQHREKNGKTEKLVPDDVAIWRRLGWQEPGENSVVLVCLKNRMGPATDIPLRYEGKYFLFSEVPTIKEAEDEAAAKRETYHQR
mgnify:CR=1 FL=1